MYGLVCTIVGISVHLVFYLIDFIYVWGGLLSRMGQGLVFIITLIAILMTWKKGQESVSYKEAFLFGLFVTIFYSVFMLIYDFLFFSVICPNYYQTLVDKTMQMMIDFKVPDAQIEETRLQLEKGREGDTPVLLALFGMGGVFARLIGDSILLCLIALAGRKSKAE